MAGAAAAHQRVTQLVKDYGSIETVHPAVTALRRSQANDLMFQRAMTNHYKLLLNRSSKLEDCEVNIVEAAFVKLMEDAKTHAGAIQIYVEELLGLKVVTQPLKLRALMGAVKIRTMFLHLAMYDDRPKPSPAYKSPPFTIPQTESGTQLLNNLMSRSSHAPFQFPLVGASATIGHPLSSNVLSMNSNQPRSTLNHSAQHDLRITDKENRPPVFCDHGSAYLIPTVTMDDPRLADLLSSYRIAKQTFSRATADTAGYLILADELQNIAKQCIFYISRINPSDTRLHDLCDTFDEASGVGEKFMLSQDQ
ncbi:MAG: hypothetical protein LQ338_007555 [Usnochroma carphineum]|nr:MAG: hypothetical protein LQ338_007555 [Usnochroma carphineum]